MEQQKAGSIVNLSSVADLRGDSLSPIYSMSKFAISGLTCSAALAYAPKGIRKRDNQEWSSNIQKDLQEHFNYEGSKDP